MKRQFKNLQLMIITLIFVSLLVPLNPQVISQPLDSTNITTEIDSSWYWLPLEIISDTSTNDGYIQDMATDSNNNLHVVWEDITFDLEGSGADKDIFYRQWNYVTNSWLDLETVSTESTDDSNNAVIAVSNDGMVHVAWRDLTDILSAGPDADVFYKSRSPEGVWSSTELVSDLSTSAAVFVDMAVNNDDNLIICWHDFTDLGEGGSTDIFYNKLDITSDTWLGMSLISEDSILQSANPAITVDSNNDFHVVWEDRTDFNSSATDYDVVYRKYDTSASKWLPLSVISTESTDDSSYPDIAVSADNQIHVIWEDSTDYDGAGVDGDVFYKNYDPQLSAWTITEVVSVESTSAATFVAIDAEDNGFIHITWMDLTDLFGSGFDNDIYYKNRNPLTKEWSSLAHISAQTLDTVGIPSITIDSLGHVTVAWYDNSDFLGTGVDYDIVYRKLVGSPEGTELLPIIPNPSSTGNISLNWVETNGATEYLVYESSSYIHDKTSASLLSTTNELTLDLINVSEGIYYYAIIASNLYGESELSNVVSVTITEETIIELETPGIFENISWGEVIIVAGIVSVVQIALTIVLIVTLKASATTSKKTTKKK